MRRTLILCTTFVIALPIQSAAAPASEDAPVSAPIAAFAKSLGLDPARDRARFISELIRLVYTPPGDRRPGIPAAARGPRAARAADAAPLLVSVPLTADVWGRAVFHRSVPLGELVPAILADRSAALLCHGLAGADDATLEFLSAHPDLLTFLHEHGAAAFGAFGASLRVRGDRVVPPGGDDAVPLWESAVGERVEKPDRFVRALYGGPDGRLAYLYGHVSQLDRPHARFVLGLWIADARVRGERFTALAAASLRNYREWHLYKLPFSRPQNDFALLIARLQVEPSGEPAPPADRAFWTDVFESRASRGSDVQADAAEHGLVDAAFLADVVGAGDLHWRADRLDQLSFGQRRFADLLAASRGNAIAALKSLPRARMLMWALERMGIQAPAVYAAAGRRAKETSLGDPNHVFWALAQLQGALALIARMRMVGTIDAQRAEELVSSVCAVPIGEDHRYEGGIARWMESELLPALPSLPGAEARLIAGLSGPVDASRPRVRWEGQEYWLDFASSERRRLSEVREKQGGYSVDLALDLHRVARALASDALTTGDIQGAVRSLTELAARIPARSRDAEADVMAPGIRPVRVTRDDIQRTIEEVSKIGRIRDPPRAPLVAATLVETSDVVLSEALLSLVYAVDIGDPGGTALLASNVALRHDFGLVLSDPELRARRAWDVPMQDLVPGSPWRVTGSLLGLDIALAPLALRRVTLEGTADAPRLPPNEREAFAVGAALMDPRAFRDGDRDAIVAAIARGRARVAALTAPGDAAESAADAVALDGWRRRALVWTLSHQPSDAASMFSLGELTVLGGGVPNVDLDVWGTSAFNASGCACTRLFTPERWGLLAGRPQVAFMSSVVPDLNLRVATVLSELHLPAGLERPVLEAAVQDFIHDTAPSDSGDWLTLARSAQAVSRQRIEDYVAAAAAVDGPLVPIDEKAANEP